MSLVLYGSDDSLVRNINFVNWRDPTAFYGQRVKLDGDDRFIWATGLGGCPMFNLPDPIVIWPNIGQRLYKAKGTLRADAPEHPLRLFKMFGRALSPVPAIARSCVVCTVPLASHCALCGLSMHAECGRRLIASKHVSKWGVSLLPAAKDSTLPGSVDSFLILIQS